MPNISTALNELIQKYQLWHKSLQPKEGVPLIHVDEVASRVAVFYEKLRMVLDWREEHLLRRGAIERILKRRMFLKKEGNEVAEPLVLELIRGGHFPNDKIEETKIDEIKKALDKYLFILKNSPSDDKESLKISLYDWIVDIAACEVEEILAPPLREKALINYMTKLMTERVEVVENAYIYKKMSLEEKKTQIFIACHRSLFKLDSAIITYYLLQKKYPNWQNLSNEELKNITAKIYEIQDETQRDLNHPLGDKFYNVCEKYDTAYLILNDVLSENPNNAKENIANPETLEDLIRKFYQKRLERLKGRITKAAIFSTVSIFLTKILVALALEMPFEKYFWGKLNYQALTFNIVIPPLLMMILVATIKHPHKENLNRVIMEVIKIVYEQTKKDVYLIRAPRKKGFLLNTIIIIFYLIIFIVSFGLTVWMLHKLHFSILSIVIFLMFFSLIAFAGVKIRERAKELNVMEEKGGVMTFLLDSFSLPFIRVGKWLSHQWTKYNIVLVLVNAFIDMPFQLFTEFLEHWRTFLKEKKEEIH